MEKDTDITKVIFRKFKDGDILALFPYEDYDGHGSCLSYMRVGQHGVALYYGMMEDTKPATSEEYLDLKTELESLGYNLKIIKRRQYVK